MPKRPDLKAILRTNDPRAVPTYGIPEAANYLRIPPATLRSWVSGRFYDTGKERRWFKPLIALPDKKISLLSFINLAEAHVLSACRRVHNIPLPNIRKALDYVSKAFSSIHPLIERDFETDGIALFVTHLGQLVDATAHGQTVMRKVVEQHLKRLERENDIVMRLYPFTRPPHVDDDSPKSVFFDPRHAFGRLVLASISVPVKSIAERFEAGDTIEHLALDYGCQAADVEEALRCEFQTAA
ncbi:MAG TPA: DUF433 domain-containing protein [Pirellulales bacterium]|jgi:uncharacterized protein (DUF433 family)|nr:DUF433 domain-containing protein [Pirellulales bacterium]